MMYVVRSGQAGTGFLRDSRPSGSQLACPLANVRTLAEIQADSMAPTSFATVMLATRDWALLLALVSLRCGVVIVAERTYVGIGWRSVRRAARCAACLFAMALLAHWHYDRFGRSRADDPVMAARSTASAPWIR